MIGFHHEIAIRADAALADELRRDAVRKVRRVEREIEEERRAGLGGGGAARQVGHGFFRRDAQARIVAKRRRDLDVLRPLPFGVVGRHEAKRVALLVLFFPRPERRGIRDAGVLDVGQDAVVHRGGDAEVEIEAALGRTLGDGLRPIALPDRAGKFHLEMPLADDGGGVALALQQRCDRHAILRDQAGSVGVEHAALERRAPSVASRE